LFISLEGRLPEKFYATKKHKKPNGFADLFELFVPLCG